MNALKKGFYTAIAVIGTSKLAFAVLDTGMDKINDSLKGGDSKSNPIDYIQSFVVSLMKYLALIMIAMALYGGFKIMTSGSEDEGKEAGKKIIINAVTGLVVIFFAYTIVNLVGTLLSGGK